MMMGALDGKDTPGRPSIETNHVADNTQETHELDVADQQSYCHELGDDRGNRQMIRNEGHHSNQNV